MDSVLEQINKENLEYECTLANLKPNELDSGTIQQTTDRLLQQNLRESSVFNHIDEYNHENDELFNFLNGKDDADNSKVNNMLINFT